MVPRLALRALYALKIVIDSRKSGFSDGLPLGRDRWGKNTSLAKEKQAESKKTVFEFPTNFSKGKKQKKRGFLKKKPRFKAWIPAS